MKKPDAMARRTGPEQAAALAPAPRGHSLTTRVTLVTLLIFLVSIWSLAFYAAEEVHRDMERVLSEQQLSTASTVAAQVNSAILDRLRGLERGVAGRLPHDAMSNRAALQEFLEKSPALQSMFNGGLYVADTEGDAVASVPVSANRIGLNYMDRDHIIAALKEGRSSVGRPVLGRALHVPVFSMATPIRDNKGAIVGTLVGVTDLSLPNFLDTFAQSPYGKTGSYVLIARKQRLIVTGSDRRRSMEQLPGPGVFPAIDKFLGGYEGTAITKSPIGEVLAAVKNVPAADWYVAIALPTDEAFAPAHSLLQRMLLAATVLTVLAGGLVWWMLRRQLQPLQDSTAAAAELSVGSQPLRLLPIPQQREIGQLVGGFNQLLTELTQREESLKASETRYRRLVDNSPDIVYEYSLQRGGIYYSAKVAEVLGHSVEYLCQHPTLWSESIHPDDKAVVLGAVAGLEAGKPFKVEYRVKNAAGEWRWLFDRSIGVRHEDGDLIVEGLAMDVTERKAFEEQVRKLSLAVEQSPSSIVITDLDAKIEYVNDAFVEITGYARDEVIGQNPRILHSGKTPPKTYVEMWSLLTKGQAWRGELFNRAKDGREFTEFAVISPLRQPDGRITHYVSVKEDVTQRKAAEQEIQTLAFSDPLTGLPNRRLVMNLIEQAIAVSQGQARQGHALLFVDLDEFRVINDTLGHDHGDLLLQQAAKRLGSCIRDSDTVGRFGGDEFVVLLKHLGPGSQEAAAAAESAGRKILFALSQPYHFGGATHHCTSSVGITLFGSDQHESAVEPLKRAELAMYQAKAAGRNALRFFDPQMQASLSARAALEDSLREGIRKRQFVLYYQPQVQAEGRVVGVEALLRWVDPLRGMVSPADFIPLAEETGLIEPLGKWVIETACDQLAAWATQPERADLTLAVNVSARQFQQDDFVYQVLAALSRSGARPQRLKLELTESALVANVEGVIAKMNVLKGRGVGFSLDDFGTGYSSLSYLKRLPLDQLKIDQGFVRDILVDPNDAAIAKMVVALADSMGLRVIAEGIETEAQRDFLAELGCRHYQGYLFSRPLPIDELEQFLNKG